MILKKCLKNIFMYYFELKINVFQSESYINVEQIKNNLTSFNNFINTDKNNPDISDFKFKIFDVK